MQPYALLLVASANTLASVAATTIHVYGLPDYDPAGVLENHSFESNTGCTLWSSHQINSMRPVNLGPGCQLIMWEDQICQEEIQNFYAVNSKFESGRCFSTDGIGLIEAFSVMGCQ